MTTLDADAVQISDHAYDSFERVVQHLHAPTVDAMSRRALSDALAAVMAEITPVHRAAIAAAFATGHGATGRLRFWSLPPGVGWDSEPYRRKWAALLLMDCVAYVGDRHMSMYTVSERDEWLHAAHLVAGGDATLALAGSEPDPIRHTPTVREQFEALVHGGGFLLPTNAPSS